MNQLNPTDYPTSRSQLLLYKQHGFAPANAFLKSSTSNCTDATKAVQEANKMIVRQVFGTNQLVFTEDVLATCPIGPWAIPDCGPYCDQTKQSMITENEKRPNFILGNHVHDRCEKCSHQGELQLADELCYDGKHLTVCCYK